MVASTPYDAPHPMLYVQQTASNGRIRVAEKLSALLLPTNHRFHHTRLHTRRHPNVATKFDRKTAFRLRKATRRGTHRRRPLGCPSNSCTTCKATETSHASGDAREMPWHTPRRTFESKTPCMGDNRSSLVRPLGRLRRMTSRFGRKASRGLLGEPSSRYNARSADRPRAMTSKATLGA